MSDAIEVRVRSWANVVVPWFARFATLLGARWEKRWRRKARMRRKKRRGWA